MKGDFLLKTWSEFAKGKDFKLNSDKWHVNLIVKGVLENEKRFGLKLCPCRLRDGTVQRDLELICPCNFKAQENWRKRGMCWCGLFVRK